LVTATAIGPQLVGSRLGPLEYRWSPRDAILYSLGIGARLPRDLEFLYERCGPRLEPTFALTAITPMLPLLVERLGIDLRHLLHAGQRLTVLRQLEPVGAVSVTRMITGVWDKRTAALIECEDTVVDDQGIVVTAASQWWLLGAGGFGGRGGGARSESTSGGGAGPESTSGGGAGLGSTGAGAPVALPDRQPDVRTSIHTTTEQAALYRLSGDLNPVHVDPAFARQAGQPRPLLHGLCTFGALGHALCENADDRRLTELSGRFREPVFPGDRLDIEIWTLDDATALATVSVAGTLVLGPARASFA
jgi:acyl dehydratase